MKYYSAARTCLYRNYQPNSSLLEGEMVLQYTANYGVIELIFGIITRKKLLIKVFFEIMKITAKTSNLKSYLKFEITSSRKFALRAFVSEFLIRTFQAHLKNNNNKMDITVLVVQNEEAF